MNKKSEIIAAAVAIVLIVVISIVIIFINKNNETTKDNTINNVETSDVKQKDENKDKKKEETKKEEAIVKIGDETHVLKNEANVGSIYYLENYVDFNTDRVGNTRMMSYNYNGEFSFDIRVNYEEEHSIDEVKAMMSEYTEGKKEVNGITYTYYEYKNNLGDDAHYYLYEYNGHPCSFVFFLGKNPGNIEEVFMNNVSFK